MTDQTPLEPFSIHALDVHYVDIRNADSQKLLEDAYAQLCQSAFLTDGGGDGEPLETWLDYLSKPEGNLRYIALISGQNLTTGNGRRRITSISLAKYFADENVGLLAFNVVAPEFRGLGMGRKTIEWRMTALLNETSIEGKTLDAVFLELDNPARVPPGLVTFDPHKRLAMYTQMGAKILPVDYVVPTYVPGEPHLDYLLLMGMPHLRTGNMPTPAHTENYLKGFFRHYGDPADPVLATMIAQLRDKKGPALSRWPALRS